ncbi:hypothetical protein [Acetobacter syzygii]|nr:hypothetical protein [Acetobacter syzygii]
MYTLPSTEDRLKNGIRLSDCYHAFALLDDWIEDNFSGMSRAMRNCMKHGVPADAFYYPEILGYFVKNKDAPPDCLRTFEYFRDAIYQDIKSLLKSGRITAYGKEKITDEKWQIIPCQYFSLECEISFHKNKVTVEGVSFLDVRITCLEGLPIWCAMVAYGDQELVPELMHLVGLRYYQNATRQQARPLIDDIQSFRKYFCSLMKNGELKAVYLETNEPVDPALWNECNISLIRSEIRVSTNEWQGIKIQTPSPPLNKEDTNTLAVNTARVPTGTRGYKGHDAELVREMRSLIEAKIANNSHQAALLVVDKAKGGGTSDSKVKRLLGAYKKTSPFP